MVIFHSYLSLPEGIVSKPGIFDPRRARGCGARCLRPGPRQGAARTSALRGKAARFAECSTRRALPRRLPRRLGKVDGCHLTAKSLSQVLGDAVPLTNGYIYICIPAHANGCQNGAP